jgi:exodeoxyribonuclease VII large subunit
VLTVSQLASKIDSALRTHISASVKVLGEVSGFRDRTHWYFDLKDADSVVSCVMFASAARKAGFTPGNGAEVVVSGRVEYYAKGGKVSLIVERMEPVGAGALDLQLRRLVEEMRGLGWLDPARKRRLPTFPRRVAVVTSRTAAALQDVLVTMQRRCPAVGVLVCDTRVQGDAAGPEIARTIELVSENHERLGVDAILVTRGGGSMEDLWCFNDRVVAEAIVRARVPVVAAIGHETDTTIAELVADERAATPTQAAMRLTPDASALLRQVSSMSRSLSGAVERRVELCGREVASVSRHAASAIVGRMGRAAASVHRASAAIERVHPRAVLAQTTARFDAAALRLREVMARRLAEHDVERAREELVRAMRERLRVAGSRLSADEKQLKAVGPYAVLERGYSVTQREDGTIVRRVTDARPGDSLRTRVADGQVNSVVAGGGPGGGPGVGPGGGPGAGVGDGDDQRAVVPQSEGRPARRSTKKSVGPKQDQPDLFG